MSILEPDVELANAAKSLANSEERYRLLIDGLSVGIWDWIIPTNDLYWSSRYKEIVCSDTELKDTYEEWEDRLHPVDKNEVVSALSNHLKHRIPYDVEYKLRRDDGNYIWIHAKGKAMWNVDGKPVRMVGSIEDISWRKQIEENIKSETIRLTAVMNTVLDGLITINHQGIIHSFNRSAERIFGYTPEEVIGQNVKMLMPEPYRGGHDGYLTHYMDTGMVEFSKLLSSEEAHALSPDGREYLELIIENGYKLQNMMDGLLQYSRLNTIAKPFEIVDLNFIVLSVLAELEEKITNSHAVIDIEKMPTVDADPEQMRKLFYALIDNALKFHVQGNIPAIHISATQQEGSWVISVADNGIGIAPRNYETIFQIFKRLHTDDEYPGVGIGLALAKKIVERHCGTIFCKVLAPSGTIFTFTLPTMET